MYFASSADADLRDSTAVEALFERVKPAAVIHLAARVAGLYANIRDPVGFFEDNLLMNLHVVRACHSYRVQHAVFCLSTCIFPPDADLPLTEECLDSGPPHFSNEAYAYAKRMLACHVRYHVTAHGCKWSCVIPTNVYGPNDNFSSTDSHVIAGLVRKCYEAKNSSGGSFTVSGTGKPLRQFVFSEDLAAVILRMLDENLVGDYIFCNDDEEVSIASVASLIGKETDFKGFITFDTSQADGVFSKTATCTKLKSALGDIGFTPLEEGIRKTVNWYKNHYSTDGIRN